MAVKLCGRQVKAGMAYSICGWTCGWQIKVYDARLHVPYLSALRRAADDKALYKSTVTSNLASSLLCSLVTDKALLRSTIVTGLLMCVDGESVKVLVKVLVVASDGSANTDSILSSVTQQLIHINLVWWSHLTEPPDLLQ